MNHPLHRRDFLHSTLVAALPSKKAAAARAPLAPLQSIGRKCGLSVGIQSEKFLLEGNPALAAFTAANFNLLTPGNELKWNRLRPTPERFVFDEAEWMLAFAEKNGMQTHGHNLCWTQALPPWLPTIANKSNARQILSDHITTVAKHFQNRIISWDVVNEPVRIAHQRPDGLTKGLWLDLLGPEYIDIAFHTTAATSPHCLRILNMDNLEQDSAFHEKTRSASLNLIQQLIKRGVPVQAIGLEAHLDASLPATSAGLSHFIREVQDLGLSVVVSELDIDDTGIAGDDSTRKYRAAANYRIFITDILHVARLQRITFWTSTDKNNWLDYMAPTHPVWRRADGASHYPGLLNASMTPNPALFQIAEALNNGCH